LLILLYGDGLLAPRRNYKIEDHPFLDVRGWLFSILAATVYMR